MILDDGNLLRIFAEEFGHYFLFFLGKLMLDPVVEKVVPDEQVAYALVGERYRNCFRVT